MPRASCVTAVLALAACYHGPSADRFEPAQRPAGIAVDLRVARQRVRGELLAVEDSALLVLHGDRVARVELRAIREGTFRQQNLLISGGTVSGAGQERLRLLSRFPAGLPPELLARLLAAHGQSTPDRVPPR